MSKKSKIGVVVTTNKRGVFFGYIDPDATISEEVALPVERMRNCLRWSMPLRGFEGLASHGPTENCRVGPAADCIGLPGVTCVLKCTDEAIERWESAPWGK